jgi:hypothetical protein
MENSADWRRESVTHSSIARGLLALLCGLQGLGTLVIDLGRTHATNPEWPRHARYHVVWQVISSVLLSIVELVLILSAGPLREGRFYLAAILASVPMLGFFGALIGSRIYGGALSDPNGIRPARIVVLGSELHIDLSLVTEIIASLVLLALVLLFSH